MGFDLELEEFSQELERAAMTGDVLQVTDLMRSRDAEQLARWVGRCREIRSERDEQIKERQAIQAELQSLESVLRDKARAYDLALAVAEEARIAYQSVQVRQFALDGQIESLRERINELNADLRDAINERMRSL